jgi:D-alanyl-D-alanine carboxypeptidase
MRQIEVFVRNVYGTYKIYPANEAATLLAEIAGTKTLSKEVLAKAEKLGMPTIFVADPNMAPITLKGVI